MAFRRLFFAGLFGSLASLNFSSASAVSNDTDAGKCVGVKALSPDCTSSEALHRRDFFYVGGRYVNTSSGNLTYDQMYVEKLTPAAGVRQPNPIVFFHAISAVTWMNTPDNRKGFAGYFLDAGFQVYVIEQTSVGRGTENDLADFPMIAGGSAEGSQRGYTAPELTNAYPQSQNHTQWPGNGTKGDPIFDQFQASMIPRTSNQTAQELSMRAAGCALLRLIGRPSFLITHSIGALYAILLANDCPALVAGSVTLEPGNIPFQNYYGNATDPAVGSAAARPWGLTTTPIDYEPPAASAGELETALVGADTRAKRACVMQVAGAVRQLPKVASVPYVAVTGEASPHATYDHCTVDYLRQAGVPAEWIRLAEDRGIRGNAHFLHLELNNMEIAAVVHEWIQGKSGGGGGKKESEERRRETAGRV